MFLCPFFWVREEAWCGPMTCAASPPKPLSYPLIPADMAKMTRSKCSFHSWTSSLVLPQYRSWQIALKQVIFKGRELGPYHRKLSISRWRCTPGATDSRQVLR